MLDAAVMAKILAKPAIESSMPIFKKMKDKISYKFNDGLSDYFINSLNKYSSIKTLLHRQPTHFYDVYHPTELIKGDDVISTKSVENLFSKSNFITIIGDAGSGKSTLLKHLFISSFIESYKAPIFVNLRDLDTDLHNLERYIRESILQNQLSPSDEYINEILKQGEFLFFLDGYDEINSNNKNEVAKSLEIFIDKYPKNNFLLTSRPY